MNTAGDVVAAARSWVGTPYIHQHRAKGIGVDCAGLVIGVARELDIVSADFDINGYERTPDGTSLIAQADRFMTRVGMHELQPGHVIVIKFERDPQHVGIVGDYVHGGLSLIHALGTTDGKGRVIEQRLAPEMRSRAVQAYAMPGVTWPV